MKIKRSIAKLHKSKAEVPEMAAAAVALCRCIFLFLIFILICIFCLFLFLFDVGGCGSCDCDCRICLSYLQANSNGSAYASNLSIFIFSSAAQIFGTELEDNFASSHFLCMGRKIITALRSVMLKALTRESASFCARPLPAYAKYVSYAAVLLRQSRSFLRVK